MLQYKMSQQLQTLFEKAAASDACKKNRNRSVMGQDNSATGNIALFHWCALFRWWPLFQGTLPLVNGCGWQGQCHFCALFTHEDTHLQFPTGVWNSAGFVQIIYKKVTKNTDMIDMIRHGYNIDTTILTNGNPTIIAHHAHISINKSYTIIPTTFRNFTPPVKQSVLHIHIISLFWSRLHSRHAVALGSRWFPGRHSENVNSRSRLGSATVVYG